MAESELSILLLRYHCYWVAYIPLIYYNNSQLFHFPIFDGARNAYVFRQHRAVFTIFKLESWMLQLDIYNTLIRMQPQYTRNIKTHHFQATIIMYLQCTFYIQTSDYNCMEIGWAIFCILALTGDKKMWKKNTGHESNCRIMKKENWGENEIFKNVWFSYEHLFNN